MQSFFIWKGIDCRAMGVRLTGPVAIVWPEERVSHVQIPGRSGDYTETEGTDIYNSYIQTASIHVKDGMNARRVKAWLRGSGYVTFSGEPDRRQQARVIGAVTLNKLSRNLDTWVGDVQFYCQPLKEKIRPDKVTVTESGTDVYNMGDVEAAPLWRVTASGTSFTLSDGTNTLTLAGITSGHVYRIDSDCMEVVDESDNSSVTVKSSGEFPRLQPGNNTITGSGWSAVEIDKRERFL